jgi:hypothetical protein
MRFLPQRLDEIKERIFSDENKNRFSPPRQGVFTLILPGQIDALFEKIQQEPYLSNRALRRKEFISVVEQLTSENGYFSQPARAQDKLEKDHAVLRSLFIEAEEKVNGAITRTVRPPMRPLGR